MKRNLVIALAFVLFCLVGWAGATYVNGIRLEKNFSGLVEKYGNLGILSVKLEDYQRGLLTAKTRTVVELKFPGGVPNSPAGEPAELPDKVQIVFEHFLSHGPLSFGSGLALARIETRIVSVSPGQAQFEQALQRFPQLKEPFLVSRVTYSGALESRMDVQAIETQIDTAQLKWGGFTAESVFSPRNKTLAGAFELRAFTARTPEAALAWDGANGHFDLAEALPLVYVGKNAFKLSACRVSMSNPETGEQNNFELKGLDVRSSSSCDGKLVQMEQAMTFAGLTMDGQTYGPGVLEIELRNLDGEGLSTYQQQILEVFGKSDTTSLDQLALQFLPVYSQLLAKMAEGNPQLNIRRLHFVAPQGEIDGQLLVSFNGGKEVSQDDPAALMQRVEASTELAIHERLVQLIAINSAEGQLKRARETGNLPQLSDAELAGMARQQASAQVEALLAQNLVVRDGDKLKTTASFRQGELVVNGQNMPLF
ncbi:MAG: hypothetical protein A2005_04965 [Desulfuromonadales bacterium GWC2_61_20]|nr:MAG: hypothetical protein A2005_04965 [Desulfuromonadales bacterium GWC2_61_20]